MLNPLVGDALGRDVDRAKGLAGQSRLEGRSEAARVGALDVEGARVLLGPDIHAPETAVGEPGRLSRAGDDVQRVRQGSRERLSELLHRELGPADGGPRVQRDRILLRRLEGTVLDEFGIDAAVTRVVDVLVRGVNKCSTTRKFRGGQPRA